MIFEDHTGGEPARYSTVSRCSAGDILAACVVEADRHAVALAQMDEAVGGALANGQVAIDHQTLQALDLLRQEADGLARILNLATSMPSAEAVIEYDAIARCVPLAAQRARLTMEGE